MKQAFLRGINAISEQATCALDRAERIGMPAALERELEAKYRAEHPDGAEPDPVSDGEIADFAGSSAGVS